MSSQHRETVKKLLEKNFKSSEIIETEISEWCKKLSIINKTTYEISYAKYAYEAVGILMNGYPEELLIKDLKEGKSRWDMSIFDIHKPKKYEPVILNKNTTYVYFCKKRGCGGGCKIELEQTRSADEGMTQFAICEKCADRFRVNY